jgi:hypothetical protein
MKQKSILVLAVGIGVAAALGLVTGLVLARGEVLAPTGGDTAPSIVSYQGEVLVGGEPYTGTAYFKFAVVNIGDSYSFWSNDGTNLGAVGAGNTEPSSAVALDVQDGIFAVFLGNPLDQESLTADVFANRPRYLHVWFDEDGVAAFTDLGLTAIAAVPYALNAETLDGLDSEAFQQKVDHVVVVAKSGGDYTTINEALGSIADNGPDSVYLVWVGPGVYSETVMMKPYVHIQGAGQEVTVVTSTVTNSGYNQTQGTLVLTRNVSLRDLTVVNSGTDTSNAALLATTGTTGTLVADVTARTQGAGQYNDGIYLTGGAHVLLLDVTALAENGTVSNHGLYSAGANTILRGGFFTGRGKSAFASGLANGGGTLEAESVTALGEGDSGNSGLDNGCGGARTVLRGGSFTGRGGSVAYGIDNDYCGTLKAERVTALGEEATTTYGLHNKGTGGSGVVTVTHSVLEGATAPVYNSTPGSVTLYHSQLTSGNPVTGAGTTTCVAVSRGITFTAGTSCP